MAALHRRRILDVATRLFDERGFGNVSTEEIIQEVGYARRTLYSYFSSKELIQLSIVLEGFHSLRQQIENAYTLEISFTEACQKLLQLVSEEQTSHPYRTSSMLQYSAPSIPPGLSDIARNDLVATIEEINITGRQLDDLSERLAEQGAREGRLRPGINARMAGTVLWSIIVTLVTLGINKAPYFEAEYNLSTEDFLNQAWELVIYGIALPDETKTSTTPTQPRSKK